MRRAVAIAFALLLAGCPRNRPAPRQACGHPPNDGLCTRDLRVPERHAARVAQGATLAIEVVASEAFRHAIADFLDRHRDHATIGEWQGQTADQIVERLRATIDTISLETFGGPYGLVLLTFAGTKAFERASAEDPIRLNRWALDKATPEAIANTIIHELAHAIGLRHPHADTGAWDLARCEPPYALGSLAERLLLEAGPAWQAIAGEHCATL